MDQHNLDEEDRVEENQENRQKAKQFDALYNKVEELYLDARIVQDGSKAKSYEHQFFAGYLAALEKIKGFIADS